MVIEMELMKQEQFDRVYELFENSFIPTELRPYHLMKEKWLQQEFKIYTLFQHKEMIAAMSVWELEGFVYLENFAVNDCYRGQGIGSYLLKQFMSIYKHQLLILEVEKPSDTMSQRRIQFYQRHHWHMNPFHYIQPALRDNSEDIELFVMSYPEMLSQSQFLDIRSKLFYKVYR